MSKTRDRRYYSGYKKSEWWRAKRWRLYQTRKGICENCGKKFEFDSMELHHKVPKSKGGRDIDDNLQLLCGECHASNHTSVSSKKSI